MTARRSGEARSASEPQEGSPQLSGDPPVLRRGALVPAGAGLSIWWMGDDRITFQAVSGDTAGAYAFWLDEPPDGVGPPKHVHSREEEGFYVVDGEAEFRAGHVQALLREGDFVSLPKGVPHSWTNKTAGDAKLITFTAPGGNEGFFLQLGADGEGAPGRRATLPVEEINRRTRRYGVTYMEDARDPMEGALALGSRRDPTIVRAGDGARIQAGGVVYTIKACGEAAANAYCLVEAVLAPRSNIPEHRHAAFEEGFYVLAGSVVARVDGDRFEARAGDFVIVPWGLPHDVVNDGAEPARLLMLTAPGGLEKHFDAACGAGERLDADDTLRRLRSTGPDFGVFF